MQENKNFCDVVMPSKTEILELNQYQKSDQSPFVICADLESLIGNTGGCKNNTGKIVYNKSKRTYSIRFFNVYNIVI